MALSVTQQVAVSYNAVLAAMKGAAENQWAESAFMRELERQGAIKVSNFGNQLDVPLDYRRNPGTKFLATDLETVSTSKTEVITSALYDIAELVSPIVWSTKDEVMNPSENQKVDLVEQILTNGIESHDDLIEDKLFETSTNGFLGLKTLIPDNGQSSCGGIDSTDETMWRSQNATYVDDTDIENAFTTVWNACAKGSGSKRMPTGMVSDSATQAVFEGSQTPQQRYVDTQELKAGFKILAFKTARYAFSQYADTDVYFWNPKSLQLRVAKGFFRKRKETQEFENANGSIGKIYSALQLVTDNRSRLGVAHV